MREIAGVSREADQQLETLCSYIHAAASQPLPDEVAEKAKHHVIDTFAAILSGVALPVGKMSLGYFDTQGGSAEASVAGRSVLTNVSTAAMINAMLAHADETDDSHPACIGHPGCAVVPAALAAAEATGASGAAFLRAVVLGYDIYARTNLALGARAIYDAGRGPYSIGGAWGAAAAAGCLMGIPRERMPYLISNVAQQTSGIATWMRDNDHIEKAFHFGGMPARNGTSAASMVAYGFTGVPGVLSGRGNFLDAFSPQPSPDSLVDGLGSRFEIMETNIKKWCVGSPIQSALDSLQALMLKRKLTPETVTAVDVHLPPDMIHVVRDRGMGDISAPFCVALMIVDGDFTFHASHDPARTADPHVLAMKERVFLHPCEELRHAVPIRQAIVEVKMNDGDRLRHHTQVVRGVFENPMSRQEVIRKANDLTTPMIGAEATTALTKAVFDIDALADMRVLRPFFQQARTPKDQTQVMETQQ